MELCRVLRSFFTIAADRATGGLRFLLAFAPWTGFSRRYPAATITLFPLLVLVAGIASTYVLLGEPMIVTESRGCAFLMVSRTVKVLGTATRSSRSLLARAPVGKSGNDGGGKSTATKALNAALMQRVQDALIVGLNLWPRKLHLMRSAGRRVVFQISNVV